MNYREMVKIDGKDELLVVGMMNKEEIKELRKKGYKERITNKNGIQVIQ